MQKTLLQAGSRKSRPLPIAKRSLAGFQTLPEVGSLGPMIVDPQWAKRWHKSAGCELIHVIRGALRVELEGGVLRGGSRATLLVPQDVRHRDVFDLAEGLTLFYVFFTWPAIESYLRVLTPARFATLSRALEPEITPAFERLQKSLDLGTEVDQLMARVQTLEILLLVLGAQTRRSQGPARLPPYGRTRQQMLLVQARQYIDAHFREHLSLDAIAHELRVSPYYLSHVFSRESGLSFVEYLTRVRLQQALALLREGRLNVSEIAYAVGYDDSNYFAKVFRRHFGLAPREALGAALRLRAASARKSP